MSESDDNVICILYNEDSNCLKELNEVDESIIFSSNSPLEKAEKLIKFLGVGSVSEPESEIDPANEEVQIIIDNINLEDHVIDLFFNMKNDCDNRGCSELMAKMKSIDLLRFLHGNNEL